ncbi:MAG: hypothetical protein OJF55_000348 [Rhodanobacteraceae bacterium]|nr:MAG: hypothetical protein OJF55_000348 [Rhodanobacteraceae bacterium]
MGVTCLQPAVARALAYTFLLRRERVTGQLATREAAVE